MDAGPSRPEPADTVVYVYGVVRPRRREPRDTWTLPCTGVCGAPVSVVANGDLAAVVSPVSARDLGPQAPPGKLQDARWIATSALAHHRVLESLLGSCTVAPFKFGALCPDAEAVREMIARHRAELEGVLSRVDGAAEWDVTLSCELRALHRARPEPAGPADGAAATSEGTAYFLRRRAEERDLREADARVAARTAEVRERLAGAARASVVRRVPSRRPHREGPETVLHDAYLVADEDRERFLGAAAAQRECGRPGFGLDVSGPWPAYSFVGPVGPPS